MSFKMGRPPSAVTEQVHFMMLTLFSNLKDNTLSFNFKAPASISFWLHLFVGLVFCHQISAKIADFIFTSWE